MVRTVGGRAPPRQLNNAIPVTAATAELNNTGKVRESRCNNSHRRKMVILFSKRFQSQSLSPSSVSRVLTIKVATGRVLEKQFSQFILLALGQQKS